MIFEISSVGCALLGFSEKRKKRNGRGLPLPLLVIIYF